MIKNVKVIAGCISCRTCETVCPSNFQVAPTSKVISHTYAGNETEILMAEAMCPVQVIKVDKKNGIKLNFQKETVLEKNKLTNDIFEFVISKPKHFNYRPGQYISVMMEDWKGKFSRQYSICEVTDTTFSLTIRLYEKGRGSSKLKKLQAGKEITFLGPLGGFVLQENTKEKYFISTGTGLAPFIAMTQKLGDDIKKHFIIGGRTQKDLYFKEKVANFKNTEIHYYLSQEVIENHNSGRVTKHLQNISSEAEVYICGNPNMVQQVRTDLLQLGFDEKHIFSEDFTVSGKYTPTWKEILINGNIPFKNTLSWMFIFLGFTLASIYFYRVASGKSVFDDFLVFGSLQTLVYSLAWWSVVFVMLIRPLSDIFSKSVLLRNLKYFRKPLGILSAILITVSFGAKLLVSPDTLIQYFSTAGRWNNLAALNARTSELTALILLLTSSTFAQKKLGKWWKRVQYLSYPYFFTGMVAAIIYIQDFSDKLWYYIPFGIWIVLWIVAFVKNKRK